MIDDPLEVAVELPGQRTSVQVAETRKASHEDLAHVAPEADRRASGDRPVALQQ